MKESMYAIVKDKEGPGLSLTRVPVPEIGPSEVLIKINKTAICGTDVHIYQWDDWAKAHIRPPLVVGHEYAGEIVGLGSMVDGFELGDRVTGEGHVVCGKCRNCRAGRRHLCRETQGIGVQLPGAFAEYLALPAENAIRLMEGIPDEIAAIFDPFGNAVHTALKFDLVGEDVLITGAGPIGIMAAAVARFAGARHIVISDMIDYRLELAGKLVPRLVTINARHESVLDTIGQLGMLEGFDVSMEMSGSGQALDDMLHATRMGGKIALLGFQKPGTTFDFNHFILNGMEIQGIYGREMYDTWHKMMAMIQSGLDLTPIITHRLDFRDFEAGFEAMISTKAGKVILDWTQADS